MESHQNDIDALIDRLLYDPPHSEHQLREALGETSLSDVRRGLVRRIERGELDHIDAIVAGNVFDATGLGAAAERLVDIVSSPIPDESDEQEKARQAAFITLAMHTDFDPEAPEHVFDLSPDRYAELAAGVYSSLFEFTEMNLDLVFDFGEMLLGEPEGLRSALFDQLESYRTDTDVDAGVLYRPLLEDEDYRELWPLLLEAVVDDGVPADADWLQRNADRFDDDAAQQFRKAAMALRTKGLEEREPPMGFALVGTPDGAGAVPLFIFTERDDGIHAGHNLVVRYPSSTILDGFYIPNIVREEIDDLVAEIEQARATELAEVPLETGIEMARNALQASDDVISELPPETRLAAYRLERMPRGEVQLEEVRPAEKLDAERLRSEFHEAQCFESWFFDRTTLESAGALPVPDENEPFEPWRDETAAALAELDDVGVRIAQNARFVAQWYHLAGDDELAAQFAALAEDAEADFESSLAMELLLEHTNEAVREMQEYAAAFLLELLGDDPLRERLAELHFPTTDLVADEEHRRLDYMELAYKTIEELRADVQHADPLDDDRLARLVGPLGDMMAEFFAREAIGSPEELAESMFDAFVREGIDEETRHLVIPELLTNGRLLAMSRTS